MTRYTLDSSREWYNNLPGKRTSAAMIIRNNGMYLMIKDDYKEAMTFPTGVIDPSESAKTTVIRETREEVGLEFQPGDVAFYTVAYISEVNGFKDRFHFYFIVDAPDDIVEMVKTESSIEHYEWVDVAKIGEHAGYRRAYTELQKMLETNTQIPYFEV